MSTLKSITMVYDDGSGDQSFPVDIQNGCILVWGDDGWNALADYYEKVKHDPTKAKQVRDRKCPKAKPGQQAALTTTLAAPMAAEPLIAIKGVTCDTTQYP
jgi:hypothetical protein